MATRGIIAVQRAGGFRGRYVHWDNYPERMVNVIGTLAKRDGLTKVVTTLINDHASWSIIDDTQTVVNELGYKEENIVEGYGVFHDDIDKYSAESWFTEESTDFACAEYIYIIRQKGLDVLKVVTDDERNQYGVLIEQYPWERIGLVASDI